MKPIERKSDGSIERKPLEISRQSGEIRRGKKYDIDTLLDADFSEVPQVDGDLLEQLEAETDAIVESVRRDRKEFAEFIKSFLDDRFYICVVFQSEAQKIEFLTNANLLDVNDMHNYDNMFINGVEVARRLGIPVEPVELTDYKFRGNPSKYRKEVIGNG